MTLESYSSFSDDFLLLLGCTGFMCQVWQILSKVWMNLADNPVTFDEILALISS